MDVLGRRREEVIEGTSHSSRERREEVVRGGASASASASASTSSPRHHPRRLPRPRSRPRGRPPAAAGDYPLTYYRHRPEDEDDRVQQHLRRRRAALSTEAEAGHNRGRTRDVDGGGEGDRHGGEDECEDHDGQLTSVEELRDVVDAFPPGIVHAFGYGSGVFAQHHHRRSHHHPPPMLDLIFVVSDPTEWHGENIRRYPQHYSFAARNLLSPSTIARIQRWGGGCYFNPYVEAPYASSTRRPTRYCLGELPRREIKYGVMSREDLITDLTTWGLGMYVAGRMHKPTVPLGMPGYEDGEIVYRQRSNATGALAASLLLLSSSTPTGSGRIDDGNGGVARRPLRLPTSDVFESIANLSYGGDFRMDLRLGGLGMEDPDKVRRLVHGGSSRAGSDLGGGDDSGGSSSAQYRRWVDMYRPPLRELEGMGLAHVSSVSGHGATASSAVEWDPSDESSVRRLVRLLPDNPRLRSSEDDIVSSIVVSSSSSSTTSLLAKELSRIVAPAARAQFWKGLLSAGFRRGVRYAAAKMAKGGGGLS